MEREQGMLGANHGINTSFSPSLINRDIKSGRRCCRNMYPMPQGPLRMCFESCMGGERKGKAEGGRDCDGQRNT